jgi:hypothetical protein
MQFAPVFTPCCHRDFRSRKGIPSNGSLFSCCIPCLLCRQLLLNLNAFGKIQAEHPIGCHMAINQRRQPPQIFLLHALELLWFGQNSLNQQRIHKLSRDFLALNQNDSHSDTAPSAISSIAAATSMVNSSARRRAWRRRATSISRAAIWPAGSPRVLAAAKARS